MRIHILDSYEEMSIKAASIVASQIILKPDSVLGLATGSTPLGMYAQLVEMFRNKRVDFREVKTFNLDEYLGLEPDHPQSYNYYMNENFFRKVNVPRENINIPPGNPENIETACLSYDRAIKEAREIDIQVLGVGTNGHIGFNEPDFRLKTETHVVNLTRETIESNSRFFASVDDVPRRAISMGMGSIMRANRILLMASGENKAEVIRKTVSGEITTEVPASLLQLHPEVILVLDKEAGSYLD